MTRNAFLELDGVHNFRDYGGWPTQDGSRVHTGMLFRSGQHVEASDADLARIARLDIRTVIDLRGESERQRFPCRRVDGFEGEVVFYEGETSSSPPHMDVDPSVTTADYARQRMIAVYTRMPENPAMQHMFARYFDVLDKRDGASLVHCFAGKDRTGIAASLLLHVLGVSRDDQLAEFLRTNDAPRLEVLKRQSLPGIEARLGRQLDDAAVRALLEVHEDYFATFMEHIEHAHGTLDSWLRSEIGVDDAMRERLIARFVA